MALLAALGNFGRALVSGKFTRGAHAGSTFIGMILPSHFGTGWIQWTFNGAVMRHTG